MDDVSGHGSSLPDAVEAAYRAIRGSIIDGSYVSGQHLTGETLARSIGVSRTPVREALRRLHAEGLVRVVPNHGAYVTGFTAEDLAKMLGLRAVLEAYAAELATLRLTEEQIDQVAELAETTYELARTRPSGFRQAIFTANSQLHQTIIQATGDKLLATMVATIVEAPAVLRTLRVYTQEDLLRSAGHHRELAAAFRARDPRWAAAVMRSHLLAARHAILGEKM